MVFLFIVHFSYGLTAETVQVTAFGYTLDLPPGWEVLDAQDPQLVSFTDSFHRAVFQIAVFPAEAFHSASEILSFMKDKFKAQGDEAPFLYNGSNAVLADFTFQAGTHRARGYVVGIQGTSYNYLLTTFTAEHFYPEYHDFLLSLLDSFAPGEEARLYPGPISQFYRSFPDPEPVQKIVRWGTSSFPVTVGTGEVEANSVVIEREARILAKFTNQPHLFPEAWKRYYQIIYRDTYPRLFPLADALEKYFVSQKIPREKIPQELLSLLQAFTYERKASLSDLESPLEAALSAKGDCDARALIYVILLRYWGYDSILLVSSTYQHAMAALDIPGEGARIEFEGKLYLVAELTDQVRIGLINRTMADPTQWIPIPFHGKITP